MSTSRKEEIIKKGFIKSLLDGTIEIKDLAGINIDLDIARQAYLQGVQETTQALIELVKENMAIEAKQDTMITMLSSLNDKTGTAVVPTNDLIHSYDTETAITEEAYTKSYETKIFIAGTYRVKFDMLSNADGHDIFGRIYLNGASHGTERITSSEEYTTYSEDLVFDVDDLLQLYTKIDSSPFYGKFRNIRLYGEYGLVYAVDT